MPKLISPPINRKQADALIAEFKSRPCTDCGQTFPPCCIDAHHIDPKDKDLGLRRRAYGIATMHAVLLQIELPKCIPLCANCHRIRHWKEQQDRKARRAALKAQGIPRSALSVW